MKPIACAVLAASLLAVPFAVSAARHEGPPSEDGMGKRLEEELGLNDAQAAQVKTAFKSHREAAKSLRERLKTALRRLRAQMDLEAGDAKIAAALEEVEAARAAVRDEGERLAVRLKSLLTPAQRAKLMLKREHGPRRGMESRREDPGRGRWKQRSDDDAPRGRPAPPDADEGDGEQMD
ncbi:MAG: periplasmic heavy metal sensor [Elusimicrobia bacterium]|nr:periplasmic heavy metal sensor [Elusimicrobiota bacterium]